MKPLVDNEEFIDRESTHFTMIHLFWFEEQKRQVEQMLERSGSGTQIL